MWGVARLRRMLPTPLVPGGITQCAQRVRGMLFSAFSTCYSRSSPIFYYGHAHLLLHVVEAEGQTHGRHMFVEHSRHRDCVGAVKHRLCVQRLRRGLPWERAGLGKCGRRAHALSKGPARQERRVDRHEHPCWRRHPWVIGRGRLAQVGAGHLNPPCTAEGARQNSMPALGIARTAAAYNGPTQHRWFGS